MPHEKTKHEFANPELSYDSKPNFQPCLRVDVFFNKNENIDYDTFYGHWQTVHADLAVAAKDFAEGVVRYTQVSSIYVYIKHSSIDLQHHQTPEMKERVRGLGEKVLDYDGCATLWFKDWDTWIKFKNSEEYAAVLGPDCKYLMTLPLTYMVGYENLVVGDASRYMGGKDGLKPKATN